MSDVRQVTRSVGGRFSREPAPAGMEVPDGYRNSQRLRKLLNRRRTMSEPNVDLIARNLQLEMKEELDNKDEAMDVDQNSRVGVASSVNAYVDYRMQGTKRWQRQLKAQMLLAKQKAKAEREEMKAQILENFPAAAERIVEEKEEAVKLRPKPFDWKKRAIYLQKQKHYQTLNALKTRVALENYKNSVWRAKKAQAMLYRPYTKNRFRRIRRFRRFRRYSRFNRRRRYRRYY